MKKKIRYPYSEHSQDKIRTPTGKLLSEITVDGIMKGQVVQEDLNITREALKLQAREAEKADRVSLSENLQRAAELVHIPQSIIFETYEMLRPGRSNPAALRQHAKMFREKYEAINISKLILESAEAYERRNVFSKRF